MTGSLLTLNAGSSSLKFALYRIDVTLDLAFRGEIEGLESAPHLTAHDAAGVRLEDRQWPPGETPSFESVLGALFVLADAHAGEDALRAVGHRVVQGGPAHSQPARVTPELMAALKDLTPLDPVHMPSSLVCMAAVAKTRPQLAQVACFDTAFHHTLPKLAQHFALPKGLSAKGVRRYGFHGLSCEYIAGELSLQSPALARGRVIIAHLGSGASLCALKAGESIDTTTGFSALEGLIMATRCGSLDPGVVLYLASQGYGFDEIEALLYHQSGLLGVSGVSGDVRVLLDSPDPAAAAALDLFSYSIARHAGAMVSSLGGLDGLVFTAGIGEKAIAVRAAVCARLAWLGLRLDLAANAANASCISAPDSLIEVRVIATDEEAMIARHTQHTLQRAAA